MASVENACTLEQDGGTSVITLRPELTQLPWADVDQIGTSIEKRIRDRDKPQVVVDLSPLDHMGSGLVALVVRVWKVVNEAGGRMVVVNSSDLVLEVLSLAGLTSRWTIVESKEAAFKTLGGKGRAAPRQVATAATDGPEPATPPAAPRGGGTALAVTGILAVCVGAVGMLLLFLAPDLLGTAGAQMLLYAGASTGLVLGIVCLVREVGFPRVAGIAVLVCANVLLIGGLLIAPPAALDGLRTDRDVTPGAPQPLRSDPPPVGPAAPLPPDGYAGAADGDAVRGGVDLGG